MMSIKHFFASANTGIGFVNLFSNINNDGFTYVIKGGSGTGKSSLMKKVGEHFFKLGFDIEFFHCSTDMNSLDGVRICEKNISIVDGTAPHVFEVSLPGINGKILDVGNFVDEKIKHHKEEIKLLVDEKKKHYNNLYGYLKCLYDLQKINQNNHKKIENHMFFDDVLKILQKLNVNKQNKKAKTRELFFDSLQEDGFQNFVVENNFKNVVEIQKDSFCLSDELLLLKEKLLELNYDVLILRNCLNPELVSSIVIPEKDAIIYGDCIKCDEKLFYNNLEAQKELKMLASNELKLAKIEHKKLEAFYIQHMNFKMVNKLTKKVIDEIEKK